MTFYGVEFMEKEVPTLINNICLMEGYLRVGWNGICLTQSYESAFNEFIHLIGFPNCYKTLLKVDLLFEQCLNYERIDSEKVDSDFASIVESDDPVVKAIATFCYVAKLAYPNKGYLTLAYVMANKILIENLIGYLIIQDNDIPMFVSMVNKYIQDGNPDSVMGLLRRCIIYE